MKYCLLLLLILLQPLLADVSIDVTKDKEQIYITDTLQVEITLHYPPETPPNLFPFIYDLNERYLPFFSILSSHIDEAKTKITFDLAPLELGTLLFTPGTISFANTPYLVPGVSVECVSTGISTLQTAPMLPLYPERRIDLNLSNQKLLLSPKILQREQSRNLFSFEEYKTAWNIVTAVLLTIPCVLLFLWALIHFELLQQVLSSSLPLKERYSKLLQLIRLTLVASEQKNLLNSLTSIEAVCYAGKTPTEEEWQSTLKEVLAKVKA